MKQTVSSCILLACIVIDLAYCRCQDNEVSPSNGVQCPLWFYFNTTTEQCECYTNPSTDGIVKCEEHEAQLRIGYCMTYEESNGIYLAHCHYFQGVALNHEYRITRDNYVRLPRNISQLNDYMCGPMNRTGRLCSECIDGFAPSITSLGSVCSNCTDAWYGVPLYLFLEFVPITIFYVIILIFRINVTSAPMVAFVYFSQVEVSNFVFFGNQIFSKVSNARNFLLFLTTLYGFWNLDFLRYIFPPFCTSPKLKIIHISFLYYISAFYPLCLICITWICIKLYSYNFKPIVCIWEKLRCCHKFTTSRDYSNSLINAFATLFLLSYAKVVFTTIRILDASKAVNLKNDSLHTYQLITDTSLGYLSREHLPYAIVSIVILLLAILPLIILLTLYPIRAFRSILFKFLSTRAITSMNTFVERYYSCYRDGTAGGKDMRSLVVLYFLLRLIVDVLFLVTSFEYATFATVLYGGCSLMIAILRPYKKAYMNIIDALLLGNMALLTLMINRLYHNTGIQDRARNDYLTSFFILILCTFLSFPLLGYVGFLTYQVLKCLCKRFKKTRKMQFFKTISNFSETEAISEDIANLEDNSNLELPDRVLYPKQYDPQKYTTHYAQYKDDV